MSELSAIQELSISEPLGVPASSQEDSDFSANRPAALRGWKGSAFQDYSRNLACGKLGRGIFGQMVNKK